MQYLFLIFLSIFLLGCNEEKSARIMEPHSSIDGISLGEWGGRWWQWAFSFDRELSPVNDYTGDFCRFGQKGDVWFLAGSYSTFPIVRKCEIPSGKKILFPVVNSIYYSSRNNTNTCSSISKSVRDKMQRPLDLYVILNGEFIADPFLHREATSDCFDPFPSLISPGGNDRSWGYPAASDGYWIAIDSLPEGEHELQFGGRIPNFSQNITYILTVTPKDEVAVN